MTMTVLVVDDEPGIRRVLRAYLEAEHYEVLEADNGIAALDLVPGVDLVLLDVGLPDLDGLEVLRRLRAGSQVAVILVTARTEEVDKLVGLAVGADDYITKPFSQRLVIERIRALLRRNELARGEGSGQPAGGVLARGSLALDENRHLCTWKGQPVQLTVTEFLLVKALAARPGIVKSRDQLIDAAYGENIYVDDRTIDSHVKRIRKKFRAVDNSFAQIETLYGIGYRYKEE